MLSLSVYLWQKQKQTFLEKVGVGSKVRTEAADEWDNNGWEEDPGRKIYLNSSDYVQSCSEPFKCVQVFQPKVKSEDILTSLITLYKLVECINFLIHKNKAIRFSFDFPFKVS